MGEISFIVLNGGLITSKYYIQVNRMSDISVIVNEWKEHLLTIAFDSANNLLFMCLNENKSLVK